MAKNARNVKSINFKWSSIQPWGRIWIWSNPFLLHLGSSLPFFLCLNVFLLSGEVKKVFSKVQASKWFSWEHCSSTPPLSPSFHSFHFFSLSLLSLSPFDFFTLTHYFFLSLPLSLSPPLYFLSLFIYLSTSHHPPSSFSLSLSSPSPSFLSQ